MVANLSARNFCVLRGTLDELVIWLKSKIEKKVTPVDVALKVNAFVESLATTSMLLEPMWISLER